MKRYAPYLFCAAGLLALFVLMPYFNAAQPRGVRITRAEAVRIADVEAKRLGIPIDKAWSNLTWDTSQILEKELNRDPARLRRAHEDPVLGPRMGSYAATFYRRGQEKFSPYGYVNVGGTGDIIAARLFSRPETPGKNATEAELRPVADAFVRSRAFPGAPSPQFESARPNVLRVRTDWTFRYRVATAFRTGRVVPYLLVHFTGGRFSGWSLTEEYADGTPFKYESGSELAGQFRRKIQERLPVQGQISS